MKQKASPLELHFAKGHGTENDFVILHDPQAAIELTPERVRALCDRHAGIGGDGLLRVARAQALLDAGVLTQLQPGVESDDWFMDYYNADGSTAEMCGNGTRVFAHWVYAQGLAGTQWSVGTRAGAKPVRILQANDRDAQVSVEMGSATVTGLSTCQIARQTYAGLGVDMGNPHLACVVPGMSAEDLAQLTLEQPVFDTSFFPQGVNVEIVTAAQEHPAEVHMRVFERGVGETRSCGTGTVAAARAVLADLGLENGRVKVHIPGGEVEVTIAGDSSTLTGPSRIVATGTVFL